MEGGGGSLLTLHHSLQLFPIKAGVCEIPSWLQLVSICQRSHKRGNFGPQDDDDDDAGCAVFDLLVPYRRLSSVSDGRASRESAGNVSTRDASVYI